GKETALPCTCGSKSKNAPIVAPLQNSANLPIISLSGLLALLQWLQTHHSAMQGADPCPHSPPLLSPPAPTRAAGSRSTVESADARTASANVGDAQQRRRSTARRSAPRAGGAR